MAEQRDNSGALFKNDRKEKETHPDRTGKAMIGGVEYYVSAWIKEGRSGKFLSLAFKPVEDKAQSKPPRAAAPADDFEDDQIPY